MDKIHEINQKILELKKKKEQLRLKAAETFYKRAETLLGDAFSPELALGMLAASWEKRDEKKLEEWQKKASSFFRRQAS